MAEYNRQNFNAMKQEAVRNAEEMYKKNTENKNNNSHKSGISADNMPSNKSGSVSGMLGILESLGIGKGKLDNDKIVILIMIIILAKEGADMKLLLALGYILM